MAHTAYSAEIDLWDSYSTVELSYFSVGAVANELGYGEVDFI